MGGVINFAKNVYNGIKNVGIQIWNIIRNAATEVYEIGRQVVVGYLNGIRTIMEGSDSIFIKVIKGVLLLLPLILFPEEILFLGLVYLSFLIIFGKSINTEEQRRSGDAEEQNPNEEELYILNPNDNPNFENESENPPIDLKNQFFENIESFINEVRNNPDFNPLDKDNRYSFIDDDDINEIQQVSDADSEINDREVKALLSDVRISKLNNQISLFFINSIENDIQLGKKILKQIKDRLDVKYNNNVKVLETEDDYREVEIEDIEDIESIQMVIII